MRRLFKNRKINILVKHLQGIITFMLLVFTFLYICVINYDQDHSSNILEPDIKVEVEAEQEFKSIKKILYFNKYFHLNDWRFGFGNEPFHAWNCPVTNCFTTDNRSLLPSLADFDAILFHARDMDRRIIQVPNQQRRKSNQIYVFFLMESPLNDGLNYTNKRFHNFFNWTMTYREDSDIYRPYGWFSSSDSPSSPPSAPLSPSWRKPPPVQQIVTQNSSKTKLIAWIVSNCDTHSNREDYVEILKKYVQVDTFGACGKLTCSRTEDHNTRDCDLMLERDYRFYLSFENSFCSDYVTEKFYNALSINIIPIVMGGADYTKKAPPRSYINVLDYETPRHLADYLIHLANNETEYQSYFWWKSHYNVHNNERERAAQSMCSLCEKLNQQNIQPKSYPTLGKWWWGFGHCTRKGHVPWYRPKSGWSNKILEYFL